MSERDFVFWLQGFFEMTDAKELKPEQIKMIKDHLGYVFKIPIVFPDSATVVPTGSIASDFLKNPEAEIC